MSKFTKAIAAIMLSLAVVCAAGCKKTDDPNNGGNNGGGNGGGNGGSGGSTPTEEGMYLGIIGFNEQLYQKQISLLNNSTKANFKTFIGNLHPADGTALYYADYTALKELQEYSEPPALTKVALVTFTDGLDNLSTSGSTMNPEGYGSIAAYRTALHNKIINDRIHGKDVTAYTIGLRGVDVQNNLSEFQLNLEMLSSRPKEDYVFEVSNMTEALERFRKIAEDLYHSVTTVNLKLKLPGGLDDGLIIRFTFDDITEGENSSKYIQCTYKRTGDNGRRLENISYHGFNTGASSLNPVSQTETGTFHWFEFEGLTHSNDNAITQSDINRLQLFKKQGSGWQRDSEFTPGSSSEVTETKNSALIMLVLDCTTSLSGDFGNMQEGARQFVDVLCSSNVGGGGGSGNSYNIWVFPVPDNGGTVTGEGVYQEGQLCTVTATASSGFRFNGWYEQESSGAASTSANYTFTVTGGRFLYAWFDRGAPTGAINGQFTVNSGGNKVYFSQGNLQYNASNRLWQFAEHQYDAIGNDNNNISSSYSGWIDLFGWGTSGYDGKYPYMTNTSSTNYGNGNNNIAGTNYDWGVYNKISNGGNTTNTWRTLTYDEWTYVFNTRPITSGIRYTKAKVNNVNGVILLPDNWSSDYYNLSNTNNNGASFSSNTITASQWATLEQHGAVFLPAAGYRNGTSVDGVGSSGGYWSASYGSSEFAYDMYFDDDHLVTDDAYYRYGGQSVRLVCPAD